MDSTLRRLFAPRADRVRGTGWLDCPNCHEHASQDVVDQMTFAAVLTYRLTPILRRRVLVCRKCGFRRAATAGEMRSLETAGKPIRRAWLFPIGVLPVAVVLLITLTVANHKTLADTGETFASVDARPAANVVFLLPVEYNRETDIDSSPDLFTYTATDPAGRLTIKIRHFKTRLTIDELLGHFADDTGINSLDVPAKTPAASPSKVADLDAQKLTYQYKESGDTVEVTMFAFFHDGVGYTITFRAAGTDTIKSYPDIESHVISSLTFPPGSQETAPPPTPGASPSPAPTPSPSPSPSPKR